MIYFYLFFPAFFLAAVIVGRTMSAVPRSKARYAECCASIDALERELFPEWFPDENVSSRRPGAKYLVPCGGKVEYHEWQAYKRAVESNLTLVKSELAVIERRMSR